MAAASSTATSPGSIQFPKYSSSEKDFVDRRKLKKLLSNRESARRSRLKKKNLLNNLLAQVKKLKEENNQIVQTMSLSNQLYLDMEAENSILRAQMADLRHRLLPLKDTIDVIISPFNQNVNVINEGCCYFYSKDVPLDRFYMNQYTTMAAPGRRFM